MLFHLLYKLIFLGINKRLSSKPCLNNHPNVYTFGREILSELESALNVCKAVSAGNPGKSSYLTKGQLDLRKRKQNLMENLSKGNTDLATYMKSMGAMTIRYEKKIRDLGISFQYI